MELIIGCCGWPVGRQRYFAQMAAVELQETFYDPPSPERAQRLRQEAPQGFVFTMKVWQLVTHPPSSPTYRRLKRTLSPELLEGAGYFRPTSAVRMAWEETLKVARALKPLAIVFQCPASFQPTSENRAHLRQFFQEIEREGMILAWEPRGNWPAEDVLSLCRDLELVHCVDPFQGQSVWGQAVYWRLHGRGNYRYRYTNEELLQLASWGQQALAQGKNPVIVMFNNTNMWEDALRFLRLWA